MSDNDFIWRFTPSRTDPELLEAIFVQREPLLVDLLERVSESATTASKHHVLLIGPRGFGKTHLITLLNHRLSKDAAMSDRIRVAWLLEDETITSFVQLLKRIYEVLAQQYPVEFPFDWLQDLLTESPKRIRQQLETKLIESFASRTLLLCIENLDILFSGLGTSGQHDWRAFLQEHPFTTIIASTQRLFADVKSREKPFFGFFSPVPLEPLSVSDAVELLRRVAANRKATDLVAFLDSAEGRSRVRALHHLAGGNHRIYVVLSGFISRDSLDELIGPFQKMADDLTPYYQERLRWLSPQQRQIVEYLCAQDYSCVPKQIARQLLATESTISSQLKKLLEIGYVLRSESGRESRYELAEPLMRLASEVKEQQRRPLQLLVNFLRVWYRPEALPELMHRAGTDSLRRHIAAAIDDARRNPDLRIRILVDAIEKARAEGKEAELLHALEEKAHTTNTANDWFQFAYAQYELRHDYENAVQNYDRGLYLEPSTPTAWHNKGLALAKLTRFEEAISCYDLAYQLDKSNIDAVGLKGNAFYDLKRYEDAIDCYDVVLATEPQETIYLFNKGVALLLLNRFADAIACFDVILQLTPSDVLSWRGKGDALLALSRHGDAIDCYKHAINLDPADSELHESKGRAHLMSSQFEEALVCLDAATRLNPLCFEIWNMRGIVLFGLERNEESLISYNKALAINPNAAVVWNNKGALHLMQYQYPAAIECFNNAVSIDSADVLARTNKCEAMIGLKCYQEAYEGFEQAICVNSEDAVSWFGRPTCLMALNRWADALYQLRTAFEKFAVTDNDIPKKLEFLRLCVSEGGFDVANSFADLYVEFNAAGHLGDGLVRSLARIDMATTTPASLQKWRDFWTDWGKPHAEMQVPLRLFSVGVDYLIKQDPKVLLDLIFSERQIVAQVLQIEVP